MAREQFANDLGTGTTLSSAVTDTTGTSWSVASIAGMPSAPQFRIRCGSEIALVTGVSGSGPYTLTVVRGAEGTTAATHSSGDQVLHVLTAASIQAPGLFYGAFPASPAGYLTPDLTKFTFVNQGSATATLNSSGTAITLTDPSAAGDHYRMLKLSSGYPSTPFTVTAFFQNNAIYENHHPCGIYVGNGTALVNHQMKPDGSVYRMSAAVDKFTNATTYSASYTAINLPSPDYWQQFSDDGTNRIYRISRDGLNWVVVHTVGRTDFLTPSEVGVAWEAAVSPAHSFVASWIHWQLS